MYTNKVVQGKNKVAIGKVIYLPWVVGLINKINYTIFQAAVRIHIINRLFTWMEAAFVHP